MSGANNPMYGKILSEETKAKMSAANKGEKTQCMVKQEL
jgi:hypothetical protein